jgi:nucleotide-binding universal stress UspA family protein
MSTFKRILVPVDFSACSRAALDQAYSLAEQFGGTINVLHVWNPPLYVGPDVGLSFGETGQTLWDFARAAAGRDMEQFLAEFQKRGPVKITPRLEQGSPHERILSIANSGKCDLIVIGTHGRTGLSHLFLGSVAERVVRHSRCPVLTVRAESKTVAGPA